MLNESTSNQKNTKLDNAKDLNISEIRTLDLAKMIINESNNLHEFPENITDTFRVSNEVLKAHGSSNDFQKSMNDSKDLFIKGDINVEDLASLKNNKQDSFLIVPVRSDGHVFSCVVRKMPYNENMTSPLYSATLVNLGERNSNSPHQEYLFFNENTLKDTLNKTTYHNQEPKSLEDIYNSFENNSNFKFGLNLSSRDQHIGNCLVKEVEKGIKFATLPISDIRSSRFSQKVKDVKFSINNEKIKTADFHAKFLNKLKEENPSIAKEIDFIKNSYIFNKSLKAFLTEKTNYNNNFSSKSTNYSKHISFSNVNNILNMDKDIQSNIFLKEIKEDKNFKNILEGFNKVNELNYSNNMGNDKNSYVLITSQLKDLERHIENIPKKYEKYIDTVKLNVSEAYSMQATQQLELGNNKESLNCFKKSIDFNPNNFNSLNNSISISFDLGDYNTTEKYLSIITKKDPENIAMKANLVKLYGTIAKQEFDNSKVKQALEKIGNAENYIKKIEQTIKNDTANYISEEMKDNLYNLFDEIKNQKATYEKKQELIQPKNIDNYKNHNNDSVAKKLINGELDFNSKEVKLDDVKEAVKILENDKKTDIEKLTKCFRYLNRYDTVSKGAYIKKIENLNSMNKTSIESNAIKNELTKSKLNKSNLNKNI